MERLLKMFFTVQWWETQIFFISFKSLTTIAKKELDVWIPELQNSSITVSTTKSFSIADKPLICIHDEILTDISSQHCLILKTTALSKLCTHARCFCMAIKCWFAFTRIDSLGQSQPYSCGLLYVTFDCAIYLILLVSMPQY